MSSEKNVHRFQKAFGSHLRRFSSFEQNLEVDQAEKGEANDMEDGTLTANLPEIQTG